MPTSAAPRYHHGNLRAALIDAGHELARAGGPDAVVVREASRRVGVSHNAAYRHFPDRHAFLEAVGERCMADLAALMERLIAEADSAHAGVAAAEARLRATGRAYIAFAAGEPGLFRTAFAALTPHGVPTNRAAPEAAPEAAPADPEAAPGPFAILNRELDGLVAAGGMAPERRPFAEHAAWSAVHGFSMLTLEGPFGALPAPERDAARERLLDTVQRGLGPAAAEAARG